MFVNAALAKRLRDQNRWYFAGLAPSARSAGVGPGDPFLDLGDSCAFFAGDGSPLTQASGILNPEDLKALRVFFGGRASSWEAIVSPFSDPAALQSLIDLGSKPEGWESVMVRSVGEPLPEWTQPPEITIVDVDANNVDLWADVATRGFFGSDPPAAALGLATILRDASNSRRYLAQWDGEPAAAASLTLGSDIAFFGGMATLAKFRGRGLQTALLRRRLLDATPGADLATIGAVPGSASHRNAERVGFRVAYSQLSLRVPC